MKKKDIVKSSTDFNEILNYNKKVSNNEFIIFYMPNKFDNVKFGISAPKKLGNAVLRNKCKRRLRMLIDECNFLFNKGRNYIIIIKKGFLSLNYADNLNSLKKLIGGINEK